MAEPQHGTYRMYAAPIRCRCDLCREYQNERVARNRRERRESGKLNHGTRSAYDAGCKCDSCKLVRKDAYQENEKKTVTDFKQYARHNHITRDIKPVGRCPGCDEYWNGRSGSDTKESGS